MFIITICYKTTDLLFQMKIKNVGYCNLILTHLDSEHVKTFLRNICESTETIIKQNIPY